MTMAGIQEEVVLRAVEGSESHSPLSGQIIAFSRFFLTSFSRFTIGSITNNRELCGNIASFKLPIHRGQSFICKRQGAAIHEE